MPNWVRLHGTPIHRENGNWRRHSRIGWVTMTEDGLKRHLDGHLERLSRWYNTKIIKETERSLVMLYTYIESVITVLQGYGRSTIMTIDWHWCLGWFTEEHPRIVDIRTAWHLYTLDRRIPETEPARNHHLRQSCTNPSKQKSIDARNWSNHFLILFLPLLIRTKGRLEPEPSDDYVQRLADRKGWRRMGLGALGVREHQCEGGRGGKDGMAGNKKKQMKKRRWAPPPRAILKTSDGIGGEEHNTHLLFGKRWDASDERRTLLSIAGEANHMFVSQPSASVLTSFRQDKKKTVRGEAVKLEWIEGETRRPPYSKTAVTKLNDQSVRRVRESSLRVIPLLDCTLGIRQRYAKLIKKRYAINTEESRLPCMSVICGEFNVPERSPQSGAGKVFVWSYTANKAKPAGGEDRVAGQNLTGWNEKGGEREKLDIPLCEAPPPGEPLAFPLFPFSLRAGGTTSVWRADSTRVGQHWLPSWNRPSIHLTLWRGGKDSRRPTALTPSTLFCRTHQETHHLAQLPSLASLHQRRKHHSAVGNFSTRIEIEGKRVGKMAHVDGVSSPRIKGLSSALSAFLDVNRRRYQRAEMVVLLNAPSSGSSSSLAAASKRQRLNVWTQTNESHDDNLTYRFADTIFDLGLLNEGSGSFDVDVPTISGIHREGGRRHLLCLWSRIRLLYYGLTCRPIYLDSTLPLMLRDIDRINARRLCSADNRHTSAFANLVLDARHNMSYICSSISGCHCWTFLTSPCRMPWVAIDNKADAYFGLGKMRSRPLIPGMPCVLSRTNLAINHSIPVDGSAASTEAPNRSIPASPHVGQASKST
ncbi:hypothetical protein CCUS01_15882 [Colletotrichum cuscutae]|uniref:Uncharacterized protein n=1 Tax=Colletotrichum cuscutae TaxID=1209917 RepID=A0AAI9Y787_9PEZI|nr:hypothetical protein CCUS01_15882 [Colletotrichum cuscutae]